MKVDLPLQNGNTASKKYSEVGNSHRIESPCGQNFSVKITYERPGVQNPQYKELWQTSSINISPISCNEAINPKPAWRNPPP